MRPPKLLGLRAFRRSVSTSSPEVPADDPVAPVHVEILSFDGCPNRERAVELVQRLVHETGSNAHIDVIDVTDEETARERRFLGSPTILVAGRDVEPGAENRSDYAVSCRVYRTDDGLRGEPDERWVRDALLRETTA